ncbi:protein kinase [Streptomyces sp. Li-HN-5-11]|uniref:protein kinase domain-containing protein n=1 Tax=Streptomyces sp. Li-HN-5-11 TaxID=3075432 RepID=UPI0028A9996D|nr:protein kinase [Streptomyces sp. Li-HN-5-11]WNM29707.1 protein kinase [Streptomyces sp. Li-HN-5-11]
MSEDAERVPDSRRAAGPIADSPAIGGRYRLTERIGSGGMGTVWRAYDELVRREVAVKQPRLPGDPEDDEFRRAAHRLYREARAAARVDHPSAVTIHDVVVEDSVPWIVMELIRGESLHEALRRGPLGPAEAARIGLAVLGALRAAHAVGIVHRDVKPANVLLGPEGRVVLTDFGIAHVQGEESLTATGEFVGSLECVAPERMSGRGAGPASDLWSLGVLLYAAVDGSSPFRRTTVEATLAAVITADPPEPKRAGPLGPLIARLLRKDPAERPEAEEVAAALEEVAGRPAVRDAVDEETSAEPGTEGLVPEPERESGPESEPEPEAGPGPGPESGPEPEPESGPEREDLSPEPEDARPEPQSAPAPMPSARRRRLVRRMPLALFGVLLLAGLGYGATSYVSGGTEAAATKNGWVGHEEKAMNAVLFLPNGYGRLAARSRTAPQPRTAVYDNHIVQVRLLQWDKAPGTPLDEARTLEQGGFAVQYTRTSLDGHDAVLADTTQAPGGTPTRVMALVVRTGDDRMYELRVDMPKGTPDEKKGTAVFRGARDRLRIEGP